LLFVLLSLTELLDGLELRFIDLHFADLDVLIILHALGSQGGQILLIRLAAIVVLIDLKGKEKEARTTKGKK
jgi:hypothetical protein